MYSNGIRSYRKTNVLSADPEKLVLMCYEGAIDNLKIAKQKYNQKDYEGKGKALNKAMGIIDELLCSLDFEKGGLIARNLESLYNYMTRKIIQGDTGQDLGAFDEVIGILTELLSAWEEMFSKKVKVTQSGAMGFNDDRMPKQHSYIGI